MVERLDAVSQEFGDVLFARRPDWQELAETRQNADGTEHFVIRIPRPVPGDTVGGLTINTSGDEVTIECGMHWHGHRSPPWPEVVSFIDAILDEEFVFIAVYRDATALGAMCRDAAAAQEMIDKGPELDPRWRSANSLRFWSWCGTFDRTLSCSCTDPSKRLRG